MTPQELRVSILRMAIQGKLAEHAPYDEVPLEIKKKAISSPENDFPFDIPDHWCWCRLEDVATLYNGRAYKKPEMLSDGKYPLLRVGNLFTSDTWYYSDLELGPEKYCDTGDLLYAWSASFGPHIWAGGKVIYHYHIWKVELRYPEMRDYLYWVLETQTESIKRSGHGSTMIHITKAGTEKMLIPIPPLAEQKRIVAKIEELLPYIDRYEQAWSKLEDFNKRFPVDMQKSILQMAIQGKLVEQRPEEGTGEELFQRIQAEKQALIKAGTIKKEKSLSEIAENEIPFDIPESWKWVRFGDLGSYKKGPFGSALTKSMFVPKGNGAIKVYEQKNAIQKDASLGEYYITKEYFESKMKGFELFPGDIIVSCAGTIGETYVMPDEFEQGIINQALMRMKIFAPLYIPYFLVFFDFVLKKNARSSSKGSAIKNIPPFEVLKNYLVPLPPLAEQKRIVAKLEELLPLCDRLK